MLDGLTPEEIQALRKAQYNATVLSVRKPHSDLAVLRVKPDFPVPAHKPGQYGTLGLGNWEPRAPGCQEEQLKPGEERKVVKRAYSLSHSILTEQGTELLPEQREFVEFYIVLVRQTGSEHAPALTPRLFLLGEGERLFLGEKITGHYTTEAVQPDDTVLLLSTGTGEAPHNYMVWDLLRRQHRGRILAACCVRYRRDLAYLPVHQRLMQSFANYVYVPLTTREPENADQKVYIQDLIESGQLEAKLGQALDPARTHVFLCGNPKMIGVPTLNKAAGTKNYPKPPGAVEILERRGFTVDLPRQRGNIHFEEYW